MDETETDVVEVYSAADLTEAYFLRDTLGDAGISARVVGDTLTGIFPTGEDNAPRVWVFRADEPQARVIIEEYERKRRLPHPDEDRPADTWKCSTCGEAVEADFELCWNCQTPKKEY